MKEWVKAPRLPICLMAGVLTIVSFKLVNRTHEAFLPALAVFAIACATMVQNDWRDRFHDINKGKTLALRQPLRFQLFLYAAWISAVAVCLMLFQVDYRQGAICALMMVSGLLYSEARRIPMLPLITVAVTSASPVLLAMFGQENKASQITLFVLIFGTILGREIIKDLMDREIDFGYKWTLPVVVGNYFSKAVVINLAVLFMIPGVLFLGSPISVPLIFAACFFLAWKRQYLIARTAIDIAIVCALITTLI